MRSLAGSAALLLWIQGAVCPPFAPPRASAESAAPTTALHEASAGGAHHEAHGRHAQPGAGHGDHGEGADPSACESHCRASDCALRAEAQGVEPPKPLAAAVAVGLPAAAPRRLLAPAAGRTREPPGPGDLVLRNRTLRL